MAWCSSVESLPRDWRRYTRQALICCISERKFCLQFCTWCWHQDQEGSTWCRHLVPAPGDHYIQCSCSNVTICNEMYNCGQGTRARRMTSSQVPRDIERGTCNGDISVTVPMVQCGILPTQGEAHRNSMGCAPTLPAPPPYPFHKATQRTAQRHGCRTRQSPPVLQRKNKTKQDANAGSYTIGYLALSPDPAPRATPRTHTRATDAPACSGSSI